MSFGFCTIAREKKEHSIFLAGKITPRKSRKIESFEEEEEPEEEDSEALAQKGFLSKDIINFLAEREKQKIVSDSEKRRRITSKSRDRKSKKAQEALISNKGDVSIKWDLMSWTPDGYVAMVTAYNHQKQRSVPGWRMSWTWTRKEMIWSILGAQATKQGDCSKFKKLIPRSCVRNPTVVDMLPSTPYNLHIENCCKSGILKPGSVSAFELSVGNAGTSNRTA